MNIIIPKKAFNPKFYPLLREDSHRYLLLYGGAGSGKSVFAVQRFLYRLLTLPLCNLLVVRAVAATNRDSTFALFRQVISRWGLSALFACKESDLRITCANGNSVIFKGLDDTEKLKSITFPKGRTCPLDNHTASQQHLITCIRHDKGTLLLPFSQPASRSCQHPHGNIAVHTMEYRFLPMLLYRYAKCTGNVIRVISFAVIYFRLLLHLSGYWF